MAKPIRALHLFILKETKKCGIAIVNDLKESFNVFLSIVIYPVVPKNVILLRIIPTASYTKDDIEKTLLAFETVRKKIIDGTYTAMSAKIII